MKNNSGFTTEDHDFRDWLRHTAEKLKRGDLPPESWDDHPLEDSAAQRRIASLISRIAAKEDKRRH